MSERCTRRWNEQSSKRIRVQISSERDGDGQTFSVEKMEREKETVINDLVDIPFLPLLPYVPVSTVSNFSWSVSNYDEAAIDTRVAETGWLMVRRHNTYSYDYYHHTGLR